MMPNTPPRTAFLPLLLCAAVMTVAPATATVPFDCGPFLLQPGPTTMTIVVDNAEEVPAALTWRAVEGKGKGTLKRAAARHHIFTLTDLRPDTHYRYWVEGGGRTSLEQEFRTLPVAPREYRFLALGDVRSQPQVWRAVAERVDRDETDALFIVGTGDYPADGRHFRQWIDQFFEPARGMLARLPFWPAIGNHERTRQYVSEPPPDEVIAEEESHYFSLFDLPGNERWYRVDYQYVTLLVIDSNSQMSPGHDQYEWVLEQLRSPRQRFTLAAFHHAPVTSGPHGRRLDDGTFREWPLDQLRRFIMPLFEIYGVDLVLNGHDHLYERSQVNGVTYVVTGGGGAPLYAIDSSENPHQQVAVSENHYATIDVSRTSLTLTAIGVDGSMLDWFVLPVTEATGTRLARQWQTALVQTLAFEAATDGPSRLQLRNVLDFPVQVEMGSDEASSTTTLSPGETGRLALEVDVPAAQWAAPVWRGRLAATAQIALRGVGDGIPFEAQMAREVVVREASYAVMRMAAPTIDGDLADWPDGPRMWIDGASPTVVNPEAYSGDADLRAAIRVGWSASGLHLAFAVDDDEVTDTAGASTWQVDGVELYVDGRPEAQRTTGYADGVSQNILPALRPGSTPEGNRAWRGKDDFRWSARRTDRGYTVEVTIPAPRIRPGWTPAAGDSVRFDAMVNDLDGAALSHQRLWSTGGASSSTAGYGLLVLEE
jgi:hypothetical protein